MSANHPQRLWRHAHGLSQTAFGQMIGVTKFTVSDYETGRSFPRPRTMRRIREVSGGELTADQYLSAGMPVAAE